MYRKGDGKLFLQELNYIQFTGHLAGIVDLVARIYTLATILQICYYIHLIGGPLVSPEIFLECRIFFPGDNARIRVLLVKLSFCNA